MMVRGQCLNCAPVAWDYPPRGSLTASCGHRILDGYSGEHLSWWDWDGGELVEISGSYCPTCAVHMKVSGRLIDQHWPVAPDAAQGIEARSVETEGLDPQDESPVGEADAPEPCGTQDTGRAA